MRSISQYSPTRSLQVNNQHYPAYPNNDHGELTINWENNISQLTEFPKSDVAERGLYGVPLLQISLNHRLMSISCLPVD
jgi:hypothetical protein